MQEVTTALAMTCSNSLVTQSEGWVHYPEHITVLYFPSWQDNFRFNSRSSELCHHVFFR